MGIRMIALDDAGRRAICFGLALASVIIPQDALGSHVGSPELVRQSIVASAVCTASHNQDVVAPQAVGVLLGMLAEVQPRERDQFRQTFQRSVMAKGVHSFVLQSGINASEELLSAWKTRYKAEFLSRLSEVSRPAGFNAPTDLPLPPGPRLLLLATEYVQERWRLPFAKSNVQVRGFQGLGGRRQERFMSDNRMVSTAIVGDREYVSLPYASGSRLVLITTQQPCNAARQLQSVNLRKLSWGAVPAAISIPMFRASTAVDMLPIIEREAPELLEGALRGARVTSSQEIARFSVGPNGTEGSAVAYADLTYLAQSDTSPRRTFIFDRPFAFALVDPHGLPLFVGTYR